MAPKAKAKESKGEVKQKQKVVEDKTFGLKNKNKSKAVQKFIKTVQAQVTGGRVKNEDEMKAEMMEKAEERRKQKQQKLLLATLQKAQDALKGATTNNKAISEAQKMDIYVDPRAQKQLDTIDQWDQSKLEDVIKSKHGGQQTQSDIVCKFFLNALEKQSYGWFWQCPNGDTCHYKHALPPGYRLVLKSVQQANAGEIHPDDVEPIEEIIERRRQQLPPGGTPVTLESFTAWKEKKIQEAEDKREAEIKKREQRSGRKEMSGRALFLFDPTLAKQMGADSDDEEDDNIAAYMKQMKEDEAELEAEALREAQRNLERAQAAEGVAPDMPIGNAKVFDKMDEINVDDLDD